jgi:hypothetical protein
MHEAVAAIAQDGLVDHGASGQQNSIHPAGRSSGP